MDIFKTVQQDVLAIVKSLISERLDKIRFSLPPTSTGSDYATNAPLVLARPLKKVLKLSPKN